MNLTQKYLKSVIHYDPKTGYFTRLKAAPRCNVGDIAGTLTNGYVSISVKNKLYRAHRLAFLYMNGKWPKNDIDHINQIKDDNRWENLRDCTCSQNLANVGPQINNTSGYKGVCWHKARNKWQAQIRFKGKQIYLGVYYDIKNAAIAYNIKAKELLGDFAHQNKI